MAEVIKRYSVYWVQLDPTMGRETRKTRPCVVISREEMHESGMAVVCPMTTKLHPKWAHRMQIQMLGAGVEIMLDQVRAVSTSRFGNRIDGLKAVDAEILRQNLIRLYATI